MAEEGAALLVVVVVVVVVVTVAEQVSQYVEPRIGLSTGEGIRVAAIRPGLIDTEIHASGGEPDRAHRLSHMVPRKRVGTADEIANAIVWLISDEASYVTSAILDVSGGR